MLEFRFESKADRPTVRATTSAPILVIFHDEAQNDDAFGTPAGFVAAWRHVVEFARAEGADNVAWVWSLSSSGFPTIAGDWYPGDEWVDWIATTGFDWYTGDPVSQRRTFPSIFAPFYEWSARRGRPLLLASVSSAENPNETADGPRSKATWIREALETLERWPEIRASCGCKCRWMIRFTTGAPTARRPRSRRFASSPRHRTSM